jgi:autotransporter-associated beta strand protein
MTFSTDSYTITGNTLTLGVSSTPVIDVATGTATINSVIAGSNGLVKSGTGTLTIGNGTNTYRGTTISQGTLVFNGSGTRPLGSAFGTVTLGDASTGSNAVGLEANFGGSLALIPYNIVVSPLGTGTVTIGSTVFNAGPNQFIQYNGTITLNRDVILMGGNADRTTYLRPITGTGNITIAGGRTTFDNSSNNFVGNITIDAGAILQTNAPTAIPVTTTVNIIGNGILQFNNTAAQVFDGLNGSASAVVRLAPGAAGGPPSLTIGAANGSGDFAGQLGDVSSLIKAGTGTQVLSGTNTYTGVTTISEGILSTPLLANGGAPSGIGASANVAANLVLDGGTLQYTGSGAATDRLFTLTTKGGSIDASGSGSLTFSNTGPVALSGTGARSLTLTGGNTEANLFAPVLGDNGGSTSLIKTGTGTWVLTATNSYSGGTAINGGTLQVSADTNLGAATGPLSFNGGTLATTASFISARTTTLNAGGGTFDVAPARTLTLSGAIGGAGALTKADTGTLVLTATNSYSGSTIIAGGALQLGDGITNGSIVGNVANSGTLVFDPATGTTMSFGGVISGNGAVNQIGTGTTILTGTNTYTGGTTITAGTLQLGNGGTTGDLLGNVSDNGTLTFNRSGAKKNFAGVISGSGSLIKLGSDTLELAADNTYSGGTTIEEGILVAGVPVAGQATSFALGTGDVNLVGGTLRPPSP